MFPIVTAIALFLTLPLSIVVTLLLSPLWNRFEALTGIESIGHSGPSAWCYIVVLVSMIVSIFIIAGRLARKKTTATE